MSNETITINVSSADYWSDINMNSGTTTISTDGITISNGVDIISITDSDTITFSGLDEFVSVTKAEHNELIERVNKLEAMLAEEAELRANHPALKMAYDEYRLLLVLAKKHDGDDLTAE
jgi:hypothetical protein